MPLVDMDVDTAPTLAPAAPGPARLTADEILDLVALHVAATLLPARASVKDRERVRQTWRAALRVVDASGDQSTTDLGPWALAYVPGVHAGDNDTSAVHVETGRVFGGSKETRQAPGEGTEAWLVRLTTVL